MCKSVKIIDYITIVGTNHYHGIDIFKVGKTVELIRDYENSYVMKRYKYTLKD